MANIKFGTDGWRAIIALDYTVDNVKLVAQATATWLKGRGASKVVIGYDCRFGGTLFTEAATQVFGANGIKVIMHNHFVSTPMVSLGVVKTGSDVGVVITASHNPPSYNGFKLKSNLGGPMIPSEVSEVEALIGTPVPAQLPSLDEMKAKGLLEYVDLEKMYLDHVAANFDLDAIHEANIKVAYDAMYGAGQDAMRKLLPDAVLLHCDFNPSFRGQAPEPIHRNLMELSTTIASDPSIKLGIANDGDADRIGLYDEDGEFVDSHHILLLLLLYMHNYKKQTGKVVFTFSVTDKLKKMADKFGLPVEVTAIGFKYIAEIMATEDVIVGGEESGGLAVKGHIPERDGIWIGLMILEFMSKTGKSLKALIQEVYDIVGPFAFERDDVHLAESKKQAVIKKCTEDPYKSFGPYPIVRLETIDGFKFVLSDDEWILVRPSGTEPVLRVYSQAPSAGQARTILDAARKEMGI
ncbi:MAG TPA: phosphoglucomutase/phosphomannomutase family protein [Flavilitoribacter sp.]|nr:phosphoglucomutase/phosphomannomutase family protein [Flavilitoribacter sp.]HMQ90279.1 phosphoglucomutase/phosphomannomutase family protein [Flavilitoribacter sp.]